MTFDNDDLMLLQRELRELRTKASNATQPGVTDDPVGSSSNLR
jgi:hypothetical protein